MVKVDTERYQFCIVRIEKHLTTVKGSAKMNRLTANTLGVDIVHRVRFEHEEETRRIKHNHTFEKQEVVDQTDSCNSFCSDESGSIN